MCSDYNSLKCVNVVNVNSLHIDEFITRLKGMIDE